MTMTTGRRYVIIQAHRADTTVMRRTSPCTAALLLVVLRPGSPLTQGSHAAPLQPGPFPYISGTELGRPMMFENEIDSTHCYPLIASDSHRVLAWLSAAYAVNGRVVVRRCIELAPGYAQTGSTRDGEENEWWEDAHLTPDRESLVTSRVRLPDWSIFSSGAFCDAAIAYWGRRGQTLIPTIYDLRSGRIVASRSLGDVELETDDRGYLPPPTWNASCSNATFSGGRINQPDTTLRTSGANKEFIGGRGQSDPMRSASARTR